MIFFSPPTHQQHNLQHNHKVTKKPNKTKQANKNVACFVTPVCQHYNVTTYKISSGRIIMSDIKH